MTEFADKAEEDAFFEVYEFGPDRARAVVMVAIVENRIDGIFRALLLEDTAVWNELFQSAGPLGNLGTKIRVLYLLRLLNRGAYKDLLAITKIRNTFSHEPRVRSFDDQPVCDWTRNLTTWETFKDTRNRLQNGQGLATRVAVDIFNESLETTRDMFRLAVRLYIGKLAWIAQKVAKEERFRPSLDVWPTP